MKQLLSALLVCVLIFAILAGCTPSPDRIKDDSGDTEPAGSQPAPVPGLALTVGEHELDTVQLNYHYMDAIASFCNSFSKYGEYATAYLQIYTGLNVAKPLSQQIYDEETNQTWADFFVAEAVDNAHWTYAMYDAAMDADFTLSAEQQAELDSMKESLDLYASYMGYQSGDEYIQAIYGENAGTESYLAYYEAASTAAAYAEQHYNGLEFTQADLQAYESGNVLYYNSYSYTTYYVSVANYLKQIVGDTEEYTDEQRANAAKIAEETAKTLAAATTSKDALDLAIVRMNLDPKLFPTSATQYPNVLYSNISSQRIQAWLTEPTRTVGDVAVLENGSGDNIEGYYVVLFEKLDENRTPLANVQHILLLAKTADEKTAAREKAEDILDGFLNSGTQDSAAFAALVQEYSEDTGSKASGGLIENICRNGKYVANFETWALEGHKPGDTGIIETEYGIHIMYYKEDGDMTYRDVMIDADLRNDTQIEWENGIKEKVTAIQQDTSGLDADYVISP